MESMERVKTRGPVKEPPVGVERLPDAVRRFAGIAGAAVWHIAVTVVGGEAEPRIATGAEVVAAVKPALTVVAAELAVVEVVGEDTGAVFAVQLAVVTAAGQEPVVVPRAVVTVAVSKVAETEAGEARNMVAAEVQEEVAAVEREEVEGGFARKEAGAKV
jgi:hypothetical protein